MMLLSCVFGFSKQHWDWIRPWSTVNLFASFIVWFAPVGQLLSSWIVEATESFFWKNVKCFFLFFRHTSCRSSFCAVRFVISRKSSSCCTSRFLHFFSSFSHFCCFSSCFSSSSSYFSSQIFFSLSFFVCCTLSWTTSNSWCLLCRLWSVHRMSLYVFSFFWSVIFPKVMFVFLYFNCNCICLFLIILNPDMYKIHALH